MRAASAGLFKSLALDVLPRALGLCDRNAGSTTAGCCDRAFWHYRTTDTPNARTQESGWLFALTFVGRKGCNPYAGKPRLAEWSRQAWRFWLQARNRDGSVCEVYPYERSFCATSFTAAAFLQTVIVLGGPEDWSAELEAARPTLRWLARNAKQQVANQVAASLEALAIYANLTGEPEFHEATERRLAVLLKMRDECGFFSEYGGPDLGYQSITMATLVRTLPYLKNRSDLLPHLRAAARSYLERCDENAVWDPVKNSRRTQFLYPSAFVALCPEFLHRITLGLERGVLLRPSWMDDRYCVPFAIDYLFTSESLGTAAQHQG